MRAVVVTALLAAVAAPAAGQNTLVNSVRGMYEMAKTNVVRSAEQMPEEHYAFKPTPDVRSFGQLVGHVANANYMICSWITGQENPNSRNYEDVTAKADLVKAVTDSFTFCDAAYSITDEDAKNIVQVFGRDQTKMLALTLNTTHEWEHYGNIVTYMRLKGLVPPSSQGM